MEYVTPLANDRGHPLVMDVPRSFPPLYCDRQRIRQVLLNLLDNAIKHTPKGTIILLGVKQRHSHLLFEVRDSDKASPKTGCRDFLQHMLGMIVTESTSAAWVWDWLCVGLLSFCIAVVYG